MSEKLKCPRCQGNLLIQKDERGDLVVSCPNDHELLTKELTPIFDEIVESYGLPHSILRDDKRQTQLIIFGSFILSMIGIYHYFFNKLLFVIQMSGIMMILISSFWITQNYKSSSLNLYWKAQKED